MCVVAVVRATAGVDSVGTVVGGNVETGSVTAEPPASWSLKVATSHGCCVRIYVSQICTVAFGEIEEVEQPNPGVLLHRMWIS